MKKKKFVFGMGCGCCGTASLALLLNSQPNAHVSHEMKPILPWSVKEGKGIMQYKYGQLDHQGHLFDLVGDVGGYYLPYVGFLMKSLIEVNVLAEGYDFKFVIMKRDKEDVVEGFVKKLKRQRNNPLQDHNDPTLKVDEWDNAFPKYNDVSLEDAIRLYYDDYYKIADIYVERHPDNVRMFDVNSLNTETGVKDILDFVGVVVKLVITSACHAEERGFKSRSSRHFALKRNT